MRDEQSPQPDPATPLSTEIEWVEPDPPPIPQRIRQESVARWLGRPRLSGRSLKLGAACLLGVAMVGAGVWWLTADTFDGPAERRWQELCNDYGRWFGEFARQVGREDHATFSAAGLGDLTSDAAAAPRFDPRQIARQPEASLRDLRDDPPPAATTPFAIDATHEASVIVERVERSFAQWPVLHRLREHRRAFADAGYTSLADRLQKVLNEAPPYGPHDPAEMVQTMVRLDKQTTDLAEMIASLEKSSGSLREVDDPVIALFFKTVADVREVSGRTLPAEPVAAANWVAERIAPLEAFAGRLTALVTGSQWPQIDRESFAARGRAYAMLRRGGGSPAAIFRAWMDEASRFVELEEDWRWVWAGQQNARLAEVRTYVEALQGAGYPLASSMGVRADRIDQELSTLLERPWVAGEAADSAVERGSIERQLDELESAARGASGRVAAQQVAAGWRRPVPLTEEGFASPAVDGLWQQQRRHWADRLAATGDVEAGTQAIAEVRQHLLGLIDPSREGSLPLPGDLGSDALPPGDPLGRALRGYLDDRREAALKATVAGGYPIEAGAWTQARREYLDEHSQARQMLAGAASIKQMTAGWRDPADEALQVEGKPLLRSIGAWPDSAPWSDPEVAKAAQPLRVAVAEMAAIEHSNDPSRLRQVALEGRDPSIAFAAWRRLGELPAVGGAAALEAERAIQRRLRTDLMLVDSRTRRDEITRQLDEAGPARWESAMRAAASEAQLGEVVAAAGQWGVQAPALSAEMKFNLLLHDARESLRQEAAEGLSDDRIMAGVETLATGLEALPEDPRVDAIRQRLRELADRGPEQQEVLAQSGPAGAGWQLLPFESVDRIGFAREGWELWFVRLELGGGEAVYVSEDELPVGVAVQWADADWVALLPSPAEAEQRRGPRAWTYGGSGGSWPQVNPGGWLAPPAASADGDLPSPRHPMNYLPPEAAVYLAGRLGCQLPTVAQWLTALQRFPVRPGQAINVRDQAWGRWLMSGADGGSSPRALDYFREGPAGSSLSLHPIDDGEVWFTPAAKPAAGGGLNHLIGNVAEYVTVSPIDPAPLLDTARPIDQRRQGFARRHRTDFAVLGGSAVSPADLDAEVPQPVDLASAGRGFCDVGLRLVFEPRRVSPAEQGLAEIQSQPYLWPLGP